MPGGPSRKRGTIFFSGNLPRELGQPIKDVDYPSYQFKAEVYLAIDCRRAEEHGIKFYVGGQGAVMCQETVPPECFVYWQTRAGDRPVAGADLNQFYTGRRYEVPWIDPAVHTSSTAAAQAAAKGDGKGLAGPPAAAQAAAPGAPPAEAQASAAAAAAQAAAPENSDVTQAAATAAALVLHNRSRVEDQTAGDAECMKLSQEKLAPSPENAVILPLQPMVECRAYQRSRNDTASVQPARAGGQDPNRSDLLSDEVGNALLRVPSGLPMCITQAHDADLHVLRSLLRDKTEWSVSDLTYEVQPKLRDFVLARTGEN